MIFRSFLFFVLVLAFSSLNIFAQNCVLRDDFNRSDSTNMGPNWTEQSGDFSISGNRAVGVNQSVMSFNGNTTGERACVDLYSGGNSPKLGSILLKYTSSSDNLKVSLQDSDSDAMFDRIYFERDSGFSFNAACTTSLLSSPIASGRLTAYLDGTTLKGDIDTNFDGTVDQSYQCTGAPTRSGTKTGLSNFGQVQFDNFANPLNTLTVNKTADTNDGVCNAADCSLREAIATANAAVLDDLISFAIPSTDAGCAGGVCTIALGGNQLTINNAATAGSVTISNNNGTASNLLVSGNNASRVFNIAVGANVAISGLTVTGGKVNTPEFNNFGGGIYNAGTLTLTNSTVSDNSLIESNPSYNLGGGIYNTGNLTLVKSRVSGNKCFSSTIDSQNQGGGIYNTGSFASFDSVVSDNQIGGGPYLYGAGIFSLGNTTITNSTVSDNSTSSGNGTGIGMLIGGTSATITNSTISGNTNISAGFMAGGGIYVQSTVTVNMTNSTVTGNTATHGGGISVDSSSTLNVRNSIISGNTASSVGPNISGSLSAASQNNVVGDEANVRLAPLGFYGGATMTHALLSGSTAINTGNNCVLTQTCANFDAPVALTTDQRGAARVGQVDIGAFELNNTANGGTYKADLPDGTLLLGYSYVIIPNNGAVSYTVSGGALPIGINVTTNFAPNAVIALSGTPMQVGLFEFSITGTDGVNSNTTDYRLRVIGVTAAGVSVGGRVLTHEGRGLTNAVVTLTDQSGNVRTVITGRFGNFFFDNIEAGQSVILSVRSRRYTFAPRPLNLTNAVSDILFFPDVPAKGLSNIRNKTDGLSKR